MEPANRPNPSTLTEVSGLVNFIQLNQNLPNVPPGADDQRACRFQLETDLGVFHGRIYLADRNVTVGIVQIKMLRVAMKNRWNTTVQYNSSDNDMYKSCYYVSISMGETTLTLNQAFEWPPEFQPNQ